MVTSPGSSTCKTLLTIKFVSSLWPQTARGFYPARAIYGSSRKPAELHIRIRQSPYPSELAGKSDENSTIVKKCIENLQSL